MEISHLWLQASRFPAKITRCIEYSSREHGQKLIGAQLLINSPAFKEI
jgi:hypothetical protein